MPGVGEGEMHARRFIRAPRCLERVKGLINLEENRDSDSE